MTQYISVADTAKLVRKALKANFPGIKFSVRSRSYAGGASIDVEWTDGPTSKAVDAITNQFRGADFDGMYDLKTYRQNFLDGEEVHFGADYIPSRRNLSRTFVETIARQFCKRFGIPMLEVKGTEQNAWVDTYALDYSMEHWFNDILRGTDAKNMHRAYEAKEEQETRERAEWEAGTAEREAQAKAEQEKREQEEKARQDRQAKAEQERQQREREEAQRRQQKRDRQHTYNNLKAQQRATLATKQAALAYLGLKSYATRSDIMKAFRNKVHEMADGRGGYTGDMDFLVKVKEKALL